MLVGSVEVMAHRNQIKPYHERESDRPNVLMHPVMRNGSHEEKGQAGADAAGEYSVDDDPMELAGSGDEHDEPFRGFPEVPVAKAASRKRRAAVANLPAAYPRRSKRLRKPLEDSSFKYF